MFKLTYLQISDRKSPYANKYCVCGRELASCLNQDSPWLIITQNVEQEVHLRTFQPSDFPAASFQVLMNNLWGSKHANFITASQEYRRILFKPLYWVQSVMFQRRQWLKLSCFTWIYICYYFEFTTRDGAVCPGHMNSGIWVRNRVDRHNMIASQTVNER